MYILTNSNRSDDVFHLGLEHDCRVDSLIPLLVYSFDITEIFALKFNTNTILKQYESIFDSEIFNFPNWRLLILST